MSALTHTIIVGLLGWAAIHTGWRLGELLHDHHQKGHQ
jgi:hypothetical protein